jgi:hypothetical protein
MQHGSHINISLQCFFSHKYGSTVTSGAGMQHGSHKYLASKFFFLKQTMRKNLCEKCCVGTVIYSGKCGKTVDAEINNVIYMDLNSGAKMADGKYRKM